MKKENDLIEFRVQKVGDLITRLMSYAKSEGLNVVIGGKNQFVRLEDIDNVIISEDEISLENIREASKAAASNILQNYLV